MKEPSFEDTIHTCLLDCRPESIRRSRTCYTFGSAKQAYEAALSIVTDVEAHNAREEARAEEDDSHEWNNIDLEVRGSCVILEIESM